MSVRAIFENLRQEKRAAFIPYITVGDPDIGGTEALIQLLIEEGADLIELGVPFSDPVADGPVNQRAAERALRNYITLQDVFRLVSRLRVQEVYTPVVVFTYFNPVHKFGIEEFARTSKESGVNAVLVVDLPPEEAENYVRLMNQFGIECIFLASPTTSTNRLSLIEKYSSGFIYYISKTGVTGAALENSSTLEKEVRSIQAKVRTPIAVGFGVCQAAQARAIAQISDGVIVGSAIVREIEASESINEITHRIRKVVRPIVSAIREVQKC